MTLVAIEFVVISPFTSGALSTNASLINFLINNPTLEFEPGTRFDYSNTGYMLLATIIERKTALSFPKYMQRNIFGPANM